MPVPVVEFSCAGGDSFGTKVSSSRLSAVALGTPVFTTFEGRLGAVDEKLLREGRLRRLSNPEEVVLEKRRTSGGEQHPERVRRDPRDLVRLLLSALD